jgi:predicted GH43/DUF377 family glycosyl hydrolase
MIGQLHDAQLGSDSSRTIAQLFLPRETASSSQSRAADIVARVMRLPATTVESMAKDILADFSPRHDQLVAVLADNASVVSSRLPDGTTLSPQQTVVLGAAITSEYATEAAALCNPSAVAHPDQSGMSDNELRVAIAMRSIGEGHLSSISFATATIGADDTWSFGARAAPIVKGDLRPGDWSRDHFRRAIEHEGYLGELPSAVLRQLAPRFTAIDLEAALTRVPVRLTSRRESRDDIDKLRTMANSVYVSAFDATSDLTQRILFPAATEENHGMEDARFVRFATGGGNSEYRATYTAYDGWDIAPRLITSPDLQTFTIHRLTGNAAHNKGMALFPRLIDGKHYALSRTDGENISLAHSNDGVIWTDSGRVHGPTEPWEIVQTGNCGSPIETAHGWVALIHGVGPMRTYSLGALLLDLDDPSKVLKRTLLPLLQPDDRHRNGYVPNVIYSCGGLIHRERIWIPIGIGDQRIGVYSITVDELLEAMVDEGRATNSA